MDNHRKQTRNYDLASQVARLPRYSLIGAREIAAISGYAESTIVQRKVPLPLPAISTGRKVLWRLADVREWVDRLGRRRVRGGKK